MVTFILRPIALDSSSVTFQILADSHNRKRGFVGNCVMTLDEFVDFVTILMRGAKTRKTIDVNLHPRLQDLIK